MEIPFKLWSKLFSLFWCPINVKVKIMIKKRNYDLHLFYLFWCPTFKTIQDQYDEKVTYSGVQPDCSLRSRALVGLPALLCFQPDWHHSHAHHDDHAYDNDEWSWWLSTPLYQDSRHHHYRDLDFEDYDHEEEDDGDLLLLLPLLLPLLHLLLLSGRLCSRFTHFPATEKNVFNFSVFSPMVEDVDWWHFLKLTFRCLPQSFMMGSRPALLTTHILWTN